MFFEPLANLIHHFSLVGELPRGELGVDEFVAGPELKAASRRRLKLQGLNLPLELGEDFGRQTGGLRFVSSRRTITKLDFHRTPPMGSGGVFARTIPQHQGSRLRKLLPTPFSCEPHARPHYFLPFLAFFPGAFFLLAAAALDFLPLLKAASQPLAYLALVPTRVMVICLASRWNGEPAEPPAGNNVSSFGNRRKRHRQAARLKRVAAGGMLTPWFACVKIASG